MQTQTTVRPRALKPVRADNKLYLVNRDNSLSEIRNIEIGVLYRVCMHKDIYINSQNIPSIKKHLVFSMKAINEKFRLSGKRFIVKTRTGEEKYIEKTEHDWLILGMENFPT